MKFCEFCGCSNINEEIFCRRCGKRFPDFDWDSVEHENVFENVMLSRSFMRYYNDFLNNDVSWDKDKYRFLLAVIISVGGLFYGFYNSLIVYYICLFILFFYVLRVKYYKLIFEIFNIDMVMGRVGDRVIINFKDVSYNFILVIFLIIFVSIPFYLRGYEGLFVCSGILVHFLLWAVVMFFNSSVYNNFSNYLYDFVFVTSLAANVVFFSPLLAFIKEGIFHWGFVMLVIVQLLIFVSISTGLFNKYARHDLRLSPYAEVFLIYRVVAPFAGFVLFNVFDVLLGWGIFSW